MEYYQGKYREFLRLIKSGELTAKDADEIFFTIGKPPNDDKGKGKEEEKPLSKKPAEHDGELKRLMDKIMEKAEPLSTSELKMPEDEPMRGKFDIEQLKSNPWFTAKLKSIFKDNAVKRCNGNKRFGELDFKKLHRIATTSKVFMRPERVDLKDYAVSLVVDCSGSMDGTRSRVAAASAMTLIKEFQQLTDIEVMTFNMREIIVKKFDDKLKDDKIAKIGMTILKESASPYGAGNHDHMALQASAKSLLTRKGRKVMIVLSDGQPSCGCDKCRMSGDQLSRKLCETVKDLRGQGITPLSVGIEADCVKRFYPDFEVITNVNGLYDAILRLLDRTIKRLPVK